MVEIARTSLVKNLLRPRTVVAAGDSITIGASTASSPQEYTPGYAETSIYNAGGLRLLANAGVAGNTAAQLYARFNSDVVAQSPDAALIMIGTNDFVSGMANSAYAALFNALEGCILMALDNGILPVIVTPPPKNSAATEASRAQPYYYWLAEYYGLPLIDAYRLWVDPANGSYASGFSGDGTHPAQAGIASVFPVIGGLLRDLPSLVAPEYLAAVSQASANDPANMVRNGAFALGTAPSSITGWTTNTTNNTITLENPTRPETGKVCKNVLSSAGGIFGLSGTNFNVVAGNEMILSGKLKTSTIVATTNGAHVQFALNGGGQFRPMKSWLQNGEFIFSNRIVVPTGKTTMTPQLYLDQPGTYEISNLTAIDRTAMAAIWQPGQQGL